jgi:hypothetical protein
MSSTFLILISLFPHLWFEPEAIAGNILSPDTSSLSLFFNPARLPQGFSLYVSLSEPYGIKSLKSGKIAVTSGGVGAGASFLKDEGYIEAVFLSGLKRKIGRGSLGFNLKILYLGIEGFRPEKNISLDMGIFIPLGKFAFGCLLSNLNSPRISNSLLLPSLDLALKVNLERDVDFYLDFFNEPPFPLSIRAGIKWRLWRKMDFLAGTSSSPKLLVIGISLNTRPSLSFSIKTHQILQDTRSLSLSW